MLDADVLAGRLLDAVTRSSDELIPQGGGLWERVENTAALRQPGKRPHKTLRFGR